MLLSKFQILFSSVKKIPCNKIIYCFLFIGHLHAQNLPIGYINYYAQKATTEKLLGTINTCTPQFWNINNTNSGTILYPAGNDSIFSGVFSLNMGVIRDMVFGEYIMEFDFYTFSHLNQDSSGFCFLSPVKSPETYYAFIFGNGEVTFYFIDKGYPVKIDSKSLIPLKSSWNTLRITRDILNRSISFVVNGDTGQKIIFSHPRLVMGFVGFGTWNAQSVIRNINIWAPTAIADSTFLCK